MDQKKKKKYTEATEMCFWVNTSQTCHLRYSEDSDDN